MYYYVEVKIKPTDKTTVIYRLPKDLQLMCETEDFPMVAKTLSGCLINVPISDYHGSKKAKIVAGKIKVVFRLKRKLQTRITRSQFKRLKNVKECYNFLRHDYNILNRIRIKKSINAWKKNGKRI